MVISVRWMFIMNWTEMNAATFIYYI